MVKIKKENSMIQEKLMVVDKESLDGIADDLAYMLIDIREKLEPISHRFEKVSEVAPTLIKIQDNLENLSDELVAKIDSKSLECINDALSNLKDEISSLSSILSVSVDEVTKKYEEILVSILDEHLFITEEFQIRVKDKMNRAFEYVNVVSIEKEITDKIAHAIKKDTIDELRNIDSFKRLTRGLERQQKVYATHVEAMIEVNKEFQKGMEKHKGYFIYAQIGYVLAGFFSGAVFQYFFPNVFE